ncbi:AMP-binding protein [Streptomyces sp. NPDC055060]
MREQLPHHTFFMLAQVQPGNPALCDRSAALSAGALAHRALQTAAVLAERGIGPGDAVGVSIRSPARCVAAVLGVLAAGGCCIPLAEGLSARRRESLLCNNGARMMLTDHLQAPSPTSIDPTPRSSQGDPYDVAPTWGIAQLPLSLCREAEPLRLALTRRAGPVACVYPLPHDPTGPAHVLTHRGVAAATAHRTAKGHHPHRMQVLIPASSPLWPYAVLPALAHGVLLETTTSPAHP